MTSLPVFGTSHLGSVPHTEPGPVCERLIASLDIPAWPQLPRRSFLESMYIQYSHGLPALMVDMDQGKVRFDTTGDPTSALEAFYERYLAQDVASFALREDYAAGFFAMLQALQPSSDCWVKGQITGPISFGLTVTDQNLRASLYHDVLAEVIVQNTAMRARWQVRQLRGRRPNVVLFVDEPYMASFGSAFISLSREQAIRMLDEVFAAIHEEHALAGVHCCGNTDWSVLLETAVDILSFDAWSHLETLALFPLELRYFLDRGGVVAWGIVPNDDTIFCVTPEQIAKRLWDGLELISRKASARGVYLPVEALTARSLITPSCGLGPSTTEVADQVFRTLPPTAHILRQMTGGVQTPTTGL
ncbi:MAG: methionine synthase [Anaerolineae bacterium]|nr:methionine synthase [Anaerolineae bacterium]